MLLYCDAVFCTMRTYNCFAEWKNVLCEKPIVMDLNELEELRDLANKQNLLLVEECGCLSSNI
jgi:hypothetical protein